MRFHLIVMIALVGFLATGCDDPEVTDEVTTPEEESTEKSEESAEVSSDDDGATEPEFVELGFWELKAAVPEGFEIQDLPLDEEGVEVFGDIGFVEVHPWIEFQDSDLESFISLIEEDEDRELLESRQLDNGWITKDQIGDTISVIRYGRVEAGAFECSTDTMNEESVQFAYEFCLSVTE